VVDKPGGMTSSAVVQRVRRLLHVDKVGHTGTLDPMATGVLPLCLGQATALAQILTGQDKRYRATLRLGIATDSGDAEGRVIAEQPVPALTREMVEAEMKLMLGSQRQTPPMVSAVRVGGQRLYELARKGVAVEREARAIEIRSLKLLAPPPRGRRYRKRFRSTVKETLPSTHGRHTGRPGGGSPSWFSKCTARRAPTCGCSARSSRRAWGPSGI